MNIKIPLLAFLKNKGTWLVLFTNILIFFGPYIWLWLKEPVSGCIRSEVWPNWLIYAFIAAEVGIFIPYTWIPISLGRILFSRKDIPFSKIVALFGGFIFSCALTHLVVWFTIFYPWYHLELVILAICACISNATAFVLHWHVKTLIGLPPLEAILQAKNLAEERAKMAEEQTKKAEEQKNIVIKAQSEIQMAREEADRLRIDAEKRAQNEQERAKNEQNLRTIAEKNTKIAEEAREKLEIITKDLEQSLADNKAITVKLEEALNEKDIALSQKQLAMKSVQELSTPVLPLARGVLLSPIVGVLDSQRVDQLTEAILYAISNFKARIVIIDLTGVEVIDTQVADAIQKICAAIRLMGGLCIITGIRPAVARTMIGLEITLPDVTIENTLELGLASALNKIKTFSVK